MTTAAHIGHDLPTRQARWTRLGAGMGYTNTEVKRGEIRAAIDRMVWIDAAQLADFLDAAPMRIHVSGLFHGRRWALDKAAVVDAPMFAEVGPPAGMRDRQRLVGLESVTGERYVLLDLGYEVLDLLHEWPVTEAVTH